MELNEHSDIVNNSQEGGAQPLKAGEAPPQKGLHKNTKKSRELLDYYGYFAPGESAAAFGVYFLDEERCRSWILNKLHPYGAHCPSCGRAIHDNTALNHFWNGNRCECKECGRKFNAVSGTFLQGAQLGFHHIFLLAVLAGLMEEGLSTRRIADIVQVSPDTIRIWMKRFIAVNNQEKEDNDGE